MATKTAVKKAATATNLSKLTKAGVIPADYKKLTPTEKATIESLSAGEVQAIIGTKTKFGPKFFPKHAAHGMLY